MDSLPQYHRGLKVTHRLKYYRDSIVGHCTRCKGEGFITNTDKLVKFKKKPTLKTLEKIYSKARKTCRCQKRYFWIEKLLMSGIRKEFWKCEEWNLLKNPEHNKKNWGDIISYINNLHEARERGIGFLHLGDNGTRKTSSGMLCLINALRLDYHVHYICMRDLLADYRTLVLGDKTQDLEQVRGFVEEVEGCDFVFIDEIGKAKQSDFTEREFEGFLRKRVNDGLCTIMATNLTRRQLLDEYGKSIDDILYGNFKELKWQGSSYRKEQKRKKIEKFFTRKRKKKKPIAKK